MASRTNAVNTENLNTPVLIEKQNYEKEQQQPLSFDRYTTTELNQERESHVSKICLNISIS